jgi:chromosome segregation ATPase
MPERETMEGELGFKPMPTPEEASAEVGQLRQDVESTHQRYEAAKQQVKETGGELGNENSAQKFAAMEAELAWLRAQEALVAAQRRQVQVEEPHRADEAREAGQTFSLAEAANRIETLNKTEREIMDRIRDLESRIEEIRSGG